MRPLGDAEAPAHLLEGRGTHPESLRHRVQGQVEVLAQGLPRHRREPPPGGLHALPALARRRRHCSAVRHPLHARDRSLSLLVPKETQQSGSKYPAPGFCRKKPAPVSFRFRTTNFRFFFLTKNRKGVIRGRRARSCSAGLLTARRRRVATASMYCSQYKHSKIYTPRGSVAERLSGGAAGAAGAAGVVGRAGLSAAHLDATEADLRGACEMQDATGGSGTRGARLRAACGVAAPAAAPYFAEVQPFADDDGDDGDGAQICAGRASPLDEAVARSPHDAARPADARTYGAAALRASLGPAAPCDADHRAGSDESGTPRSGAPEDRDDAGLLPGSVSR